MDKMREEFESWAEEAGALPWGYLKRQRNPSGSYSIQIYTYMWQAWQASRKAMVVELPPACDCHSDDKDKGYDICHYAVQAKLEEQGLNFKVEGAERWSGITVKGEGDE